MARRQTEKQIESVATQLLCACGFEVVTVGGSRPQGQRGYIGNTIGIPDKLTRHRTWPRGVWLALEFKRGEPEVASMLACKDSRGIAQTEIWKRGGSWIVWKPEHALEAALTVNTSLRMTGWRSLNKRLLELRNDCMGQWSVDAKRTSRDSPVSDDAMPENPIRP